MNTSGKRVAKELAAWETTNQLMAERTPDQDRSNIEVFIRDGRTLRNGLVEIVHGESPPKYFDVERMRAWLRFSWKSRRELGV